MVNEVNSKDSHIDNSQLTFKNITMSKQEFTITVYTENQIGLLNRIAIIFREEKSILKA